MKIQNYSLKSLFGIAITAATLAVSPPTVSANYNCTLPKDVFEKSDEIPPSGTTSQSVLKNAPSPNVTVAGKRKKAAIVVDLSTNVLYKYDKTGKATHAYLVASGKKSTPTDPGLRVITNIERYPYRTAPAKTKRRRNPRDYGPRILILQKVDPRTGRRSPTGEFIHGNHNANSLGKYSSLGCIRMDNAVIIKLAAEVQKGDLVLIKK